MMIHYLSMAEIAELTGLAHSSVRTYRSKGGMPEPDITIGRVPGWLPETIAEWAKTLPGQGARTDLSLGISK